MSLFSVQVPASSANLGPGFDSLGLALNLYLELTVSTSEGGLEISISGEGADTLPRDSRNLIYRGLQQSFQALHREPPGLNLRVRNSIPIQSGLGSSSAALVAGLVAGIVLTSGELDGGLILRTAHALEGHIDNAAASFFGGLVALAVEDEEVSWLQLPVAPLDLIAVLPEVDLPTEEMRSILPKRVSLASAAANLARIPFLLDGLARGDLSSLAHASRDELHQPYRLGIIPGADQAREAGIVAGAAAVVLSGAGPSLLAFVDQNGEAVARSMQDEFKRAGASSRAFHLRPDRKGVVVSEPEI